MKQINLAGVNYRVVKKESNLGQRVLYLYGKAKFTELREVYKSFSKEKYDSYNKCRKIMYELSGHRFVITSYNIHQFTCAFEFVYENKKFIAYFTAQNNYVVCLED